MSKTRKAGSPPSSGEQEAKVQRNRQVLTASSSGKNPSLQSRRILLRDAKTGEMQPSASVGVIETLKNTGFTSAEIFQLVVSKRSLERRQQKNEQLSAAESDRALRLARLHHHAVRVFGSEEKAHRWLRKPCRALDGAIPLELMVSETGAHIVESELHAIDHGMFA
ncbi:antitoxin Xre/MbcA/ParS toxin-binding domain-containing protein [Hoeflea sp. Naph1]|uniref:type II RES/Xre toxin-antitoxin system antitoxin n=1 Tax=Hoeflea sp. Naph1 TaxID=3388653 RepID=UPI00398FB19A